MCSNCCCAGMALSTGVKMSSGVVEDATQGMTGVKQHVL